MDDTKLIGVLDDIVGRLKAVESREVDFSPIISRLDKMDEYIATKNAEAVAKSAEPDPLDAILAKLR